MAFSVNDFRSKVRDLAKNYMFEVEIVFPVAIGSSDLVNILAQSTSIPGRTAEAIDAPFMSQQYKLAGGITYDPWTVTFRVDDNYDIYKKFRAWSELIKGTESNIAAFPAQYKARPAIFQLDNSGNRLNKITLIGAWPSVVAEIAVDTTTSDIQNFDVTFEMDSNIFSVE